MAAPRYTDLEKLALAHGGYFDRADAQAHGVGDVALRRGLAKGRYERIYPGVYRLAIPPTSPHDELFLAWVWSNYRAVISHESALALYGLSDRLPSQVHLSVPLDFRRASGLGRTTNPSRRTASTRPSPSSAFPPVSRTTPPRC